MSMITKRDNYFLDLATKQAISAPGMAGAYLGAVLVVRNRPFSFGFNQPKTHPFQATYAKNKDAIFLHAEISAINGALRQMPLEVLRSTKTSLYIVRIKRENGPGSPFVRALAKPCSGCQEAIFKHKINRVIYSVDKYTVKEL